MHTGTLGLSADHRDLAVSVRAFVERHVTSDVVRGAVDAESEALPPFWKELAAQGLLGLHLPESVGGGGYGLLETAVVSEVLGHGLVPGPFLPTVIASAVLARAGHSSHLAGLCDGSVVAGLALEPRTVVGTLDGSSVHLRGRSAPVLGGQVADVVVLPVLLEDAVRWVVVEVADVVRETPMSHDPSRRLATLTLDLAVPADALLARSTPNSRATSRPPCSPPRPAALQPGRPRQPPSTRGCVSSSDARSASSRVSSTAARGCWSRPSRPGHAPGTRRARWTEWSMDR